MSLEANKKSVAQLVLTVNRAARLSTLDRPNFPQAPRRATGRGLPCPTSQRPDRRPLWPKARPVRTDRRPSFRRQPVYAATATPTGSTTAKSTSSGKSIATATGIAPRIMIDALLAASCNDLVDRWA